MKICYIGDGRSIHLRRWIDHFFLEGNEIFIITYHPAKLSNARVSGVHHEQNPFLVPVTYIVETMQIAEIIRKIQPDFVHLHYVSIDGLAPALFKNVPLIATVWGSDILYDFKVNRKFRAVIKYILRRADIITATSRFLAKETQDHIPKGKSVRVLPFGVDTDFFKPRKSVKKTDRITLCYVKGLEYYYGPQNLISALPQILRKFPSTELVMVGEGSCENTLRRFAEELGVLENIELTGFLSPDSVRKLLASVDIFIMPTLCNEAFGVAALEAQAMGLPVIASRRGGIPEAVKEGETAILVDGDDVEQLVEAICRLIENPDLRHQMGIKGREFVIQNYRWSSCTMMMEHLYRSLLQI